METGNRVPADPARFDDLLEVESRERRTAATAVVLVSGGFDPIHVGHLRLIQAAQEYGRVVVALNSDAWLKRKKGYVFMPWNERAELLEGYGCRIVAVDDEDGTVADAIVRVRPTYFANGGDRTNANEREHFFCEQIGVKELFGIGGPKVQSSSDLVRRRAE